MPSSGQSSTEKPKGPQPSLTATVKCLHCGRRQRRHLRTGKFFQCRYCEALNPGPAMVESMQQASLKLQQPTPQTQARRAKREQAAAPLAEAEVTPPQPPPKEAIAQPAAPSKPRRVVKKAGGARTSTRKPPAEAPAQPSPPATAAKPKPGGILDRLLYG